MCLWDRIDFYDMMNDRNIWSGLPGSMPWSKEALELLYKYTGGNAICGKLFGNELLEKQKVGEFRRRNFIDCDSYYEWNRI